MQENIIPQFGTQPDDLLQLLDVRALIYSYFDVTRISVTSRTVRFEAEGNCRAEWGRVRAAFSKLGYAAYRQRWAGRTLCTLVRRRPQRTPRERRELKISIILFVCTILTTLFAGYYNFGFQLGRELTSAVMVDASAFSAALLFILGSHEMGHKFAAMRNGIEATPPYFIPVPTIIGTLGAFIRLRSPMPDENASVEMGISGPIAGFIAAIPVMIGGMLLYPQIPMPTGEPPHGAVAFFMPPIINIIAYDILRIPSDHIFSWNPLIFASWVGMLVTMLNLLPIGPLDGGHIARAILGPKIHRTLSFILAGVCIVLGAYTRYIGWFVWAGIGLLLMRIPYPDHLAATSSWRSRNLVFAALGLAMLVLCFMPVPVKIY